MPLDRALAFGATHAGHPAIAAASSEVRADVQSGSTLADALRKRRAVFGALVPAMAAAGEESGALDQAMARLADHLDEANELRAPGPLGAHLSGDHGGRFGCRHHGPARVRRPAIRRDARRKPAAHSRCPRACSSA